MHNALPTLLVVGANGGIGLATVRRALAMSYRVIALVRDPSKLPLTHPQLLIVKGDVLQPENYNAYLPGVVAVISALGVRHHRPTTLYSQGNADLRRMEALFKDNPLDWTLVRPPRLTDKAATGHYRVSIDQPLPGCYSIARADVKHFMLNNIAAEGLFQKKVEIGY